jgi:hypothetical protein
MNFSHQKNMADELREMAEASGNTTLNEFIKNFTIVSSAAAGAGKRSLTYGCVAVEAAHKDKISKWLGDNGLEYKFNTGRNGESWFDISW